MKFSSLVNRLKKGKPSLAVLVDPDKFNPGLIVLADKLGVSCFLVGGSIIYDGDVKRTVKEIQRISKLPVVLFPGDEKQLTRDADGLLLLSLLSGRNPDYLIGKHVEAAPLIRKMKMPFLPTAYILIGKGNGSATQAVTGTEPIDPENSRLILNTALAASQLGFQAIYLEAGSGASVPVDERLIRLIKKNVSLPLIVGGGIDSPVKVSKAMKAGADMLVIGNVLERAPELLPHLCTAFRKTVK